MISIHLELFPLLASGLTAGKGERLVLDVRLPDKTSLRNLVNEVVSQHPDLRDAVLDPSTGDPRAEITVSVNEHLLPLAGMLDTRLRDGDRVFLLMAMPGG